MKPIRSIIQLKETEFSKNESFIKFICTIYNDTHTDSYLNPHNRDTKGLLTSTLSILVTHNIELDLDAIKNRIKDKLKEFRNSLRKNIIDTSTL